jgi:hypothetical protein
MAIYWAEIERTDILIIKFEFPDGETPSSADVLDAASYVDNHINNIVGSETVICCEKDIEYD